MNRKGRACLYGLASTRRLADSARVPREKKTPQWHKVISMAALGIAEGLCWDEQCCTPSGLRKQLSMGSPSPRPMYDIAKTYRGHPPGNFPDVLAQLGDQEQRQAWPHLIRLSMFQIADDSTWGGFKIYKINKGPFPMDSRESYAGTQMWNLPQTCIGGRSLRMRGRLSLCRCRLSSGQG